MHTVVEQPKSARKGHPHSIRVDLSLSEADGDHGRQSFRQSLNGTEDRGGGDKEDDCDASVSCSEDKGGDVAAAGNKFVLSARSAGELNTWRQALASYSALSEQQVEEVIEAAKPRVRMADLIDSLDL